jgi:very-short-patch-repair endonuclease
LRREIIEYNHKLKERARELRNNATPMEKKLWQFIKGKQIEGFDFHRQKPINNFILDFYCCELKLAIEIDGSSHIGKEDYDRERQNIIEKYGISFLRFTNNDVKNNLDGVIATIIKWIKENPKDI